MLHPQTFLAVLAFKRKGIKKLNGPRCGPLIHEISSLVDMLHDLDNDETKSTDIIVGHTERIKSTIPPNPTAIWYPQPIHQLLSAHPFKRMEIPLDVL